VSTTGQPLNDSAEFEKVMSILNKLDIKEKVDVLRNNAEEVAKWI
jgi:hypothetical protein